MFFSKRFGIRIARTCTIYRRISTRNALNQYGLGVLRGGIDLKSIRLNRRHVDLRAQMAGARKADAG